MQNQRPPRLAFSFLAGLFQRLPPRLGRLRSATGTAGGGRCTRRRGGAKFSFLLAGPVGPRLLPIHLTNRWRPGGQ